MKYRVVRKRNGLYYPQRSVLGLLWWHYWETESHALGDVDYGRLARDTKSAARVAAAARIGRRTQRKQKRYQRAIVSTWSSPKKQPTEGQDVDT